MRVTVSRCRAAIRRRVGRVEVTRNLGQVDVGPEAGRTDEVVPFAVYLYDADPIKGTDTVGQFARVFSVP